MPEDHIVVSNMISKIIEGLPGNVIPELGNQIKLKGNQELYNCYLEALKLSRIIITK